MWSFSVPSFEFSKFLSRLDISYKSWRAGGIKLFQDQAIATIFSSRPYFVGDVSISRTVEQLRFQRLGKRKYPTKLSRWTFDEGRSSWMEKRCSHAPRHCHFSRLFRKICWISLINSSFASDCLRSRFLVSSFLEYLGVCKLQGFRQVLCRVPGSAIYRLYRCVKGAILNSPSSPFWEFLPERGTGNA